MECKTRNMAEPTPKKEKIFYSLGMDLSFSSNQN